MCLKLPIFICHCSALKITKHALSRLGASYRSQFPTLAGWQVGSRRVGSPHSGSSAVRGRRVHGGHSGHAFFGCGAFRHRRVLINDFNSFFQNFRYIRSYLDPPLWRQKFIIFCLNFYRRQAKIPSFARLSTRKTIFTYCNLSMFKNSHFSCALLARVDGYFSSNYHF